jgi:hypothetical protein
MTEDVVRDLRSGGIYKENNQVDRCADRCHGTSLNRHLNRQRDEHQLSKMKDEHTSDDAVDNVICSDKPGLLFSLIKLISGYSNYKNDN